ncbi:MAG: alanine--tRNA ligase [Candidatus Omnitrophica bacterium]|nr:alanine--tRNA ligase [Candidatus Omnitrophota bacterium]
MRTNEIRKKYIDFFKNKGHVLFSSDTLVPQDPSVLFVSAGMNQFKPYFLGEKKDVSRAVSCQKCLRTGDLERVGKTAYHHTFFEMLGNFSFGDYFKKEAIEFAWEFLLKELNLNIADLWVSVYEEDEEAYLIWKDHIGVDKNKIVRLGEKSNFWPANAPSAGPNGPCGPCSEIFFDQGNNIGCLRKECDPDCSCGRFVEIWNLVFTQYNRVDVNKLEPLPQKNIDTGMGLERIACVLQNKKSNFEIDIFKPAVDFAKDLLQVKNKFFDIDKTLEKDNEEMNCMINAIVDHIRAAIFCIADGVYPSNEGRGYVVRKVIRRALWRAHLLGRKTPFLYQFTDIYSELMEGVYPFDEYSDIKIKKEIISKVIKAEEERFLLTLREGEDYFLMELEKIKRNKGNVVGASELFRLYDTYGFPLELSKDIADKHMVKVDEKGFKNLLKEQQSRSRKKSMFDENIFKEGNTSFEGVTEFVGYDRCDSESVILRVILLDKEDNSIQKDREFLSDNDKGLIVLDETPFYPEGGGQLSDKGIIETNNGKFMVEETLRINQSIVHKGKVIEGKIYCKDEVSVKIDFERRNALMRAHTSTHILQSVLRKVLGDHVTQQGSFVDEDRMRFDFTHFNSLSKKEVEKIENMVNLLILKGDSVTKDVLSLEQAKEKGALAFFKDKYKDKVRVVSIGDYSKELCGGTHIDNTCQIGSFTIISESSISSGIRRIEAVVGKNSYNLYKKSKDDIAELSAYLKCKNIDLKKTVEKILDEAQRDKEKINYLEKIKIAAIAEDIIKLSLIKDVDGVNFLIAKFCKGSANRLFEELDFANLLYLSDIIKRKVNSIFIFFIGVQSDQERFLCSSTEDLVKKGINSKKFVSMFKDELLLKGGGREVLVQGVIGEKQNNIIEKVESCLYKFIKK